MKKVLLVAAIMTISQATLVQADETQTTRPAAGLTTGLGLIAGAAIGGPVYIFGATALGAIYDTQADKKFRAEQELFAKQQDLKNLQISHDTQIASLRTELAESESRYQLASANWTGAVPLSKDSSLGYNVQFRTGSSEIEPQYVKDLTNMAKMLKNVPSLEVSLAGYSDRVGDNNYNQELSRQRAMKIQGFFVSQGVDSSRISTQAYGESKPLSRDVSIENNAFDRRVMIELVPVTAKVAAN